MARDIDMDEVRQIYEQGIAAKRNKVSWELERGYDRDFIYEVARLKGWYADPQKVQVKHFFEPTAANNVREYWTIEPYEEDCSCPNLVERPDRAENEG